MADASFALSQQAEILAMCKQANRTAIYAMQQGGNDLAAEILQQALAQLARFRFEVNQEETISLERSASNMATTETSLASLRDNRSDDFSRSHPIVDEEDLNELVGLTVIQTVLVSDPSAEESLLPLPLYKKAFDLIGRNSLLNANLLMEQAHIIILFNLGLAMHRWGTELGLSAVLTAALGCYQKALVRIRQEDSLLSEPSGIVAIMAALLYNAALLYGYFWDVRRAKVLREQLWYLVEEVHRGNRAGEYGYVGDVGFFYVNLSLAELDNFRLSPAA